MPDLTEYFEFSWQKSWFCVSTESTIIFGTKIQTYNFVIFSENWIFGHNPHNLRFSSSVLRLSYLSSPLEWGMEGPIFAGKPRISCEIRVDD